VEFQGKLISANRFHRWAVIRRKGAPDARISLPQHVADRLVRALNRCARARTRKTVSVRFFDARSIAGSVVNRADPVSVVSATYAGIYRDIDRGAGATDATVSRAMTALEETAYRLQATGSRKSRPGRLTIVCRETAETESYVATRVQVKRPVSPNEIGEMRPSDMSGYVDTAYWMFRISPLAND